MHIFIHEAIAGISIMYTASGAPIVWHFPKMVMRLASAGCTSDSGCHSDNLNSNWLRQFVENFNVCEILLGINVLSLSQLVAALRLPKECGDPVDLFWLQGTINATKLCSTTNGSLFPEYLIQFPATHPAIILANGADHACDNTVRATPHADVSERTLLLSATQQFRGRDFYVWSTSLSLKGEPTWHYFDNAVTGIIALTKRIDDSEMIQSDA